MDFLSEPVAFLRSRDPKRTRGPSSVVATIYAPELTSDAGPFCRVEIPRVFKEAKHISGTDSRYAVELAVSFAKSMCEHYGIPLAPIRTEKQYFHKKLEFFMVETDIDDFSARLRRQFPDIRFVARENVPWPLWTIPVPSTQRRPRLRYLRSLGDERGLFVRAWIEPTGWKPRWGRDGAGWWRLINRPALWFDFQRSQFDESNDKVLGYGVILAHYDRKNRDHRAFIDTVWRTIRRMSSSALVRAEQWSSAPLGPPTSSWKWRIGDKTAAWCRADLRRTLTAFHRPPEPGRRYRAIPHWIEARPLPRLKGLPSLPGFKALRVSSHWIRVGPSLVLPLVKAMIAWQNGEHDSERREPIEQAIRQTLGQSCGEIRILKPVPRIAAEWRKARRASRIPSFLMARCDVFFETIANRRRLRIEIDVPYPMSRFFDLGAVMGPATEPRLKEIFPALGANFGIARVDTPHPPAIAPAESIRRALTTAMAGTAGYRLARRCATHDGTNQNFEPVAALRCRATRRHLHVVLVTDRNARSFWPKGRGARIILSEEQGHVLAILPRPRLRHTFDDGELHRLVVPLVEEIGRPRGHGAGSSPSDLLSLVERYVARRRSTGN